MIITFGDLVLDILVRPYNPIERGSDVQGHISFSGGGSAANFAAWAAWNGMEVTFIGAVGEDIHGEILQREMEERGIHLSLKRRYDHRTGSILLFIDEEGERSMITDRGASMNLTANDLKEDLFREAQHLHMTGYSFFGGESMVETALYALELAQSYDLTISIDPSSYALLKEFGVRRFLSYTSSCDFIFPNIDEGRLITGYDKEEEILRALRDSYPIPILKLGPMGVLYEEEDGLHRVLAPIITTEDTTGAGDAFAAGFLSSYLREHDKRRSCEDGVKLASSAVERRGGRPPRDRRKKS